MNDSLHPSNVTRRRFLGTAAALSAASIAGLSLGQPALARTTARGRTPGSRSGNVTGERRRQPDHRHGIGRYGAHAVRHPGLRLVADARLHVLRLAGEEVGRGHARAVARHRVGHHRPEEDDPQDPRGRDLPRRHSADGRRRRLLDRRSRRSRPDRVDRRSPDHDARPVGVGRGGRRPHGRGQHHRARRVPRRPAAGADRAQRVVRQDQLRQRGERHRPVHTQELHQRHRRRRPRLRGLLGRSPAARRAELCLLRRSGHRQHRLAQRSGRRALRRGAAEPRCGQRHAPTRR